MTLFTAAEVRRVIADRYHQLGSQKALARELGVSLSYANGVLVGKRLPGPAILKAFGFERVPAYRKLEGR